MTRRMVAALAATLLLWAPATTAQAADDYLVLSTPEAHEELDSAPGWVTLVFKTEASATYAAIVVHNSAGENVATGPLIPEGTNVTTQLIDNLPRDTYTVIYRTEDADGEPRGGAFQFAYGPGTWTEVDDSWVGSEEQPPEIDDPGPAPSVTAEPEETVDPGETTSPEPSTTEPTTESPTQAPVETPTATQPPGGNELPGETQNPTGWLVAIGAGLAAVAVGALVVARRRSTDQPRHAAGSDDSDPPHQG